MTPQESHLTHTLSLYSTLSPRRHPSVQNMSLHLQSPLLDEASRPPPLTAPSSSPLVDLAAPVCLQDIEPRHVPVSFLREFGSKRYKWRRVKSFAAVPFESSAGLSEARMYHCVLELNPPHAASSAKATSSSSGAQTRSVPRSAMPRQHAPAGSSSSRVVEGGGSSCRGVGSPLRRIASFDVNEEAGGSSWPAALIVTTGPRGTAVHGDATTPLGREESASSGGGEEEAGGFHVSLHDVANVPPSSHRTDGSSSPLVLRLKRALMMSLRCRCCAESSSSDDDGDGTAAEGHRELLLSRSGSWTMTASGQLSPVGSGCHFSPLLHQGPQAPPSVFVLKHYDTRRVDTPSLIIRLARHLIHATAEEMYRHEVIFYAVARPLLTASSGHPPRYGGVGGRPASVLSDGAGGGSTIGGLSGSAATILARRAAGGSPVAVAGSRLTRFLTPEPLFISVFDRGDPGLLSYVCCGSGSGSTAVVGLTDLTRHGFSFAHGDDIGLSDRVLISSCLSAISELHSQCWCAPGRSTNTFDDRGRTPAVVVSSAHMVEGVASGAASGVGANVASVKSIATKRVLSDLILEHNRICRSGVSLHADHRRESVLARLRSTLPATIPQIIHRCGPSNRHVADFSLCDLSQCVKEWAEYFPIVRVDRVIATICHIHREWARIRTAAVALAGSRPTLLHGDFHYKNVAFRASIAHATPTQGGSGSSVGKNMANQAGCTLHSTQDVPHMHNPFGGATFSGDYTNQASGNLDVSESAGLPNAAVPVEVCAVDMQSFGGGHPAVEVAYFICTSLPVEVRHVGTFAGGHERLPRGRRASRSPTAGLPAPTTAGSANHSASQGGPLPGGSYSSGWSGSFARVIGLSKQPDATLAEPALTASGGATTVAVTPSPDDNRDVVPPAPRGDAEAAALRCDSFSSNRLGGTGGSSSSPPSADGSDTAARPPPPPAAADREPAPRVDRGYGGTSLAEPATARANLDDMEPSLEGTRTCTGYTSFETLDDLYQYDISLLAEYFAGLDVSVQAGLGGFDSFVDQVIVLLQNHAAMILIDMCSSTVSERRYFMRYEGLKRLIKWGERTAARVLLTLGAMHRRRVAPLAEQPDIADTIINH